MDRRTEATEAEKPRVVLVTPPVDDAARFAPLLAGSVKAGDLEAVVLRLAVADDSIQAERVRTLRGAIPKGGPTLLLEGHAHLVERANAGGVHLSGSEQVAAARKTFKQDRTIGAGRLESRHDAMVAAEGGADYVMFGDAGAAGRRTSLPALIERVEWWSELFVIPCVAYAAHLDEIEPLLNAGADYIALGEEIVWQAPDGPARALMAAMKRLTVGEPAE